MDILIADAWIIAKVALSFLLFLYIIFSIIVVKQVHLMSATIQLSPNLYLKFLAYFHLFVALFVFILGLIIL